MMTSEIEDDYPVAKICDFGLSQELDLNGQAIQNQKCGTMGYMAPEIVFEEHMITAAIDMWGFGICLYEMAAGYKPTSISNYRYGKFLLLII